MRKLPVSFVSMTGLALALSFVLTGTAWAHHPEIEASAVCVEPGVAVIQYTASAWGPSPSYPSPTSYEHPDVVITLNNIDLEPHGEFTEENGFSFSGEIAFPDNSEQALVGVYVVGAWGDGTDSGPDFMQVAVDYPSDCEVREVGRGRFTGGGHQVDVGGVAKVTRGLTIHCDLLLSNNLEINWGGNQFHTTEHLTTIQCFDDPEIDQKPPRAPLDTLVGTGIGRFNGEDGYSIVFTLIDAGEPGRLDRMGILITAPNGDVILDIPDTTYLTGGNLQAHYDQPHGSNHNR